MRNFRLRNRVTTEMKSRSIEAWALGLIVTILMMGAPLHAATGQPDDLRAAATAFLAAYGNSDTAALRTMWSSGAAAAELRFRKIISLTPRVKCVNLLEVRIDSVTTNDATTTVRGTVVRADTFRYGPPSPRITVKHPVLTFVREGDRWKVTAFAQAETELAQRLLAAPEYSEKVLRENVDLLTPDLALSLASTISMQRNAGTLKNAAAAGALANRVADLAGDPITRALAAFDKANLADFTGDVAQIKAKGEEAVTLAREAGDADVLAGALWSVARFYEPSSNRYPDAIAVLEEATTLEDRLEGQNVLIYVLGSLATIKSNQRENADAVAYLQRAAKKADQIGDTRSGVFTELEIGDAHQNQGDYELSLLHLRRAYELAGLKSSSAEARMGEALVLMADSYELLGRDSEARQALKEAMVIGDRTHDDIVVGGAHRSLGSCLRRAGPFAESTKELEQALAVFEAAKGAH